MLTKTYGGAIYGINAKIITTFNAIPITLIAESTNIVIEFFNALDAIFHVFSNADAATINGKNITKNTNLNMTDRI